VYGATLAREAGASACELLDRTFVRIVADWGHRSLPIDPDVECVLLIELEQTKHASDQRPTDDESASGLTEKASVLERAMIAAGASQVLVGLDPESEETLWAVRHAASPILARLDPAIASMQVIEDGVVPPARLADYVRGVRAALGRADFRGVIFGHAGDANVHVNALVDVRESNWNARLVQLFNDVTELTASLGGTPTGEHGDGRLRSPVLHQFWTREALTLFKDIKDIFDPDRILNPGVKVDAARGVSLSPVKYDTTGPPIPAAAARVLERVARERAYDHPRLEMLAEGV
jgi:FAD/FMN-containing dehydrogenase